MMGSRSGDVSQGFGQVDKANDPRFFIEFLDARKTIDGEPEIKELMLQMLDLKPGARVLDVGCGTGDDTREIAALVGSGGTLVGIDGSDALVAESNRRDAGSVLCLEFRRGDVRKLDFPDSAFDRIRTDRVLMFVPEIEVALAEIVRVLRPGGTMSFVSLTADCPRSIGRFNQHGSRVIRNHGSAGNSPGSSSIMVYTT